VTRARVVRLALYLLPCVIAIALGVYAYRVLLRSQPPFQADEAGHALPAARMARTLRLGDVAGFLETLRQDVLWPFFHPLVISVFFLAFGTLRDVARCSSLGAFVATICLVPLLARELMRPAAAVGLPGFSKDIGREPPEAVPATLGWLSAAALMAAPALWSFGCTVMTESLGMLMAVVTLLCFARADRQQSLALHVGSGLLAVLTFFTKYNYGVPLAVALFLSLTWHSRGRGLRPLAAFVAGTGIPLAVWAVFVFGHDPSRIGYLWDYIRVNRDEGVHGLAALLFYPRGVLEVFGPAVGIGMLVGMVGSLLRRPSSPRLASLLFVLLTLALLLPHPNKQWRYLCPAMPVLLALAESELALWFAPIRARGFLWALAAALLLIVRSPLEGIREDAREALPLAEAGAMLRFAAEHLPRDQPVLVLGSSGLLPHIALSWELIERDGGEPDVDLMLFPDEAGWDPRYRSGYPSEMRPGYASILDARLIRAPQSVVAFELGSRSPFLPDWMARWDAWGQNYVTLMKAQPGYTVTAEKLFPGSDAAVRIYARSSP
jgi:hypothetical protein